MSEHECALPNPLGRATSEHFYCHSCGKQWVSVKAINPDGKTSIRNEWARVEP